MTKTTTLHGSILDLIANTVGWQTGDGLQQCLTAWETQLSKLAGDIQGIGNRLTGSAAHYAQTEKNVLARIQGVGAGLELQPKGSPPGTGKP